MKRISKEKEQKVMELRLKQHLTIKEVMKIVGVGENTVLRICKRKGKRPRIKCKYCGKIKKVDNPTQQYCDYECKYNATLVKYPKGWDTIKHCETCNARIIFDKSKPMNTELIRSYCSKKCRGISAHQRFKRQSPEKYKAKIKRRRQTESWKISHRKYAKIQKSRRRKLGHNYIMDNPFPSEIKVDEHHINNLLIIHIPKKLHLINTGIGRKKHRKIINKIIEKLNIFPIKILEER